MVSGKFCWLQEGKTVLQGAETKHGAHGITVKHQDERMGSCPAQFKEFLLNSLQASASTYKPVPFPTSREGIKEPQ